MRYVRPVVVAAMLLSAIVSLARLWATDNAPAAPTEADKKKIKATCQKVFDRTVDDCLKNPGRYAHAEQGANCTQVAGEMWAQCMRQHGLDAMTARPPQTKDHATGLHPKVGSASPTPGKRKVIDSGAVTTVKPAATTTPTATPRRGPRQEQKAGTSPSPKQG